MTVKEMREKLGLTQQTFADRYNIPKRTIENWESGKRKAPPYVMELLQNAVEHYIPLTKDEVMSRPLTIVDLKYMIDDLIKKGYGEYSVLLSDGNNDGTDNDTFHGMYYGFGVPDEYKEGYITLD